jgi:alpha-pyrone synthase
MPVFINAIGTANPANCIAQEDIASFMVRAMNLDQDNARKLKVIHKKSGIQFRYSVIDDYGKKKNFSFYNQDQTAGFSPSTSKRMELYRKHAAKLSYDAAKSCLEKSEISNESITHLICVSCTGMYAPGLDIDLVNLLELNTHINRTSINFMGCYAAINAIKLGHAICKAEETAKVLIVCAELCSIHFQNENTEDNMLANALFADGAAALLLSTVKTATTKIKLDSFYNEIAADSASDMAWQIGDTGFEMKLSAYVPQIIGDGISKFIDNLKKENGLAHQKVDHFVIHPGGKKILESIEAALHLSKSDNRHAYQVLEKFGNMSSPTILFVLKLFIENLAKEEHDKNVLCLAFGPGLTLESMLLKTV